MQRLLHRILATRLAEITETHEQQRSFKRCDGTLINTLLLNHYLTRRRNKGQTYNILTLDLKKAFDSVSHQAIEHTLVKASLDIKSVNAIMETLRGATTVIHHTGATSKEISIERGVRQGDPLSPYLFNLVIN